MRDTGAAALEGAVLSTIPGYNHSPPGEIDLRGDPREGEAFIIETGWAYAFAKLTDGRRQVFDLILPGDEFSFYCERTSSFSVQFGALTPIKWWRGPADNANATVEQLFASKRHMQDRLVMHAIRLGRMTALQATCSFLVEVIDRMAATGQTRIERLDFPVSQPILADLIGLSAVHMNRQLQELKRERIATKTGRMLSVINIEKLRSIASVG